MIRQASAWMLALLLGVATAFAQQGTTEVRGRVLDPQGAMLPGVTVTVRNQDTGMFRETVSGQDGTFIVGGIVPGRYELSAELQGFKKFLRRDVELEIGKTTSVDVPLEVGSISEVVNVSAETPMLDVTSKEVGGNITTRELVELPTINGNFVGFVGLLPGIVPTISTESFGSDSIAVNGQDPRNNNYMLDGGNNNDDVIGQRAGTQARTPIEAIQEFQVITNQFDAEFGRTTGAVVNAVTKSGTNIWHGSAFENFQDADLTGKDYFAKKNGLGQAGHAVSAPGRHGRRSDHQGQGAFLLQPRALHHRRRGDDQHPDAAGLQHHHDREDTRLEHGRPRRPPDQRQQHLGRALAARGVAAVQPDHRQRHARTRRARSSTSTRRWSGQLSSVLSQHQGEHDAAGVDA